MALRLLRVYFGLVGRLAPAKAARTFIRVFCTPVRHPFKPPHLELMASAERLSFTTQGAAEKGTEIEIVGYRWPAEPHARRILLLHGWSAKGADWYKLIPALSEAGYEVDALDMPGHGNSGAKLCSEVDMERALLSYLHTEGMPYAIIGHSLGAAATVLGLLGVGRPKQTYRPERVILLTHPVILEHAFDHAFNQLNVPKATQKVVFHSLELDFGYPISGFSLLNLSQPLWERTLTIYVPNDEEAPAEDTAAFLRHYPNLQSLEVPDGTHAHIMRHPKAIEAILGFLG